MVIETRYPLDNTYMPVIRFGTGPRTLVILSGVSLCGLEGQGEGVSLAYAQFADDYTVYLFDRKKELPYGYRVEDMAEDVYRVLSQLGIKTADVYGVSQGGMMAQCLALRHPGFVRRLALCSTLCRANDTMRSAVSQWLKYAQDADVVALNRCFFRQVYSPAFLEQVSELLPALEQVGTPEDCARFAILAQACADFDVSDNVSSIRCPTLVLGDMNDQVTGSDGSRELAQRIGCECFLYDKYSHAVYDEAADIKTRVYQFLTQAE